MPFKGLRSGVALMLFDQLLHEPQQACGIVE